MPHFAMGCYKCVGNLKCLHFWSCCITRSLSNIHNDTWSL